MNLTPQLGGLTLIVSVLMAFALAGQLAVPDHAASSGPRPLDSVTPVVPARLPLASQFDIKSKITGRTYRIYISKPVVPPPASGYSVLYVLDADATFATAESQAVLASMEGLKPIIVVGIGYPDALAAMSLRNLDLTPYKPNAETKSRAPGSVDDYGGGDAFYKFMLEELTPTVKRLTQVDPTQQSLMGYSLGGLFVTHILLTHPEAYKNFIIGSPSIWWNNKEVLRDLPRFAERVSAGEVSPRVLITSSEWEQSDTSPLLSKDPDKRAEEIADNHYTRMIDNAREFAVQLKSIKGSPGFSVSYVLLQGESHNSGVPAATSRGVALAVSP
jgi:uncharacterized protein